MHVKVNVCFFDWSSTSEYIRTSVPATKQFKRLMMGMLTSQLTSLANALDMISILWEMFMSSK